MFSDEQIEQLYQNKPRNVMASVETEMKNTDYPNLTLKRDIGVGLEVIGNLVLPDGKTLTTIENKKYLFNSGIYDLVWEYSPKFKTHLWEFKNIPGRAEIKIHEGYYAKNSRGCPMLDSDALSILHNTLDHSKNYKIYVK